MKELLNRADELLIKRGICGHVAAERFESDFKAYLIYFEALGYGSPDTTLTLLENEENLTDTSILNTNFRCKIDDLISQSLKADKIFMELFDILLGNRISDNFSICNTRYHLCPNLVVIAFRIGLQWCAFDC